MHVGEFYGNRTPELLLQALAAIGEPGIEFVQVGSPSDVFRRYESSVSIRVLNRVPHNEALALMKGASLLYLKQAFEKGIEYDIAVGAKTYEYLATGLPILAECPPGANADVIHEYAARSFIVTSADGAALKHALLKAYEDRDTFIPRVKGSFAAEFNRRRLAERLAKAFDELTSTKR
jgi:glycosyltransferase involved in cell wall biosynthesis